MKLSNKNRVVAGLAAILIIAPVAGCGAAAVSDSDVITLRFAHFMPTHHTNATDGADLWMQEVEERTGSRVQFESYPAGQLVSAQQMVPALRAGVVDVGIFTPSATAPADLPLSELPQIPGFKFSNLRVNASAYQEMLDGPLEEEWNEAGIQPMMSMVSGSYQMILKGEPRKELSDWTGRSVRSAGGAMDFFIEGIGAASVSVPGPEIYEALDRGTVDSGVNSLESVPTYDFDEVTDSATLNLPLGAVPMAMGISLRTYEDLPEDVKVAMKEASEDVFVKNQDALEDDLDDALARIGETLELYELTDEQLETYEPALTAAQDRWADQRAGGAEVLDAWARALVRAETEHGD